MRIDSQELLANCDLSAILDEDESYEDFVLPDPSSGCYKVTQKGKVTYFLQKSGVEFFFTPDGLPPHSDRPVPACVLQVENSAIARVLMPAHCALTYGVYRDEADPVMVSENLEFIDGRRPRYRLFRDGEPVAGLCLYNGVIDKIYVSSLIRRQHLGAELFDLVTQHRGPTSLSKNLTKDGKAFLASLVRRNVHAPILEQ
ncbi:hypothetical protein ACYPKM_00480 [Pseudomonas aeruginosa]